MVINNYELFKQFYLKYKQTASVVIPIFKDHELHPLHNKNALSLLYIYCGSDHYILSFDHPDSNSIHSSFLEANQSPTIYTPDVKLLKAVLPPNSILVDLNLYSMFNDGSVLPSLDEFNTASHNVVYRNSPGISDLNKSIPILKHLEKCKNYVETQVSVPDTPWNILKGFFFYNQTVSNVLFDIESNGLCVNRRKFGERFGENKLKHISDDGLVYTKYNTLTTTGRPTNTHAGINYSALNKKDGTRSIFESRFDGGKLVSFDFDSYHIRLIGNLIRYRLPSTSVHEYFGKQYYYVGTNDLTDEQYNDSKIKTFHGLYGDGQFTNLPFFKRTKNYMDHIFMNGKKDGYITTPIANRKIYLDGIKELTSGKLFSYLIQAYEIESSIEPISNVNEFLKDKQSKVVLYTYDSILLDVAQNEMKYINDVKDIMQSQYPVNIEIGYNFHDMNRLN